MTVGIRLTQVARALAAADGWVVAEDIDWQENRNARARHYWHAAVKAWTIITGDSPDLDAELES